MKVNPFYFKSLLKHFILGFILFINIPQGYSQFFNLEFEIYNNKIGLSQNHVSAIIQDKRGFMWFGTDDGLNRFDGHDFKVYKNIQNDSNSIADNAIKAFYLDEDGVIWIGTSNGISKFFPETEHFENYPIDYLDPAKLNGAQASTIKKDKEGNIWITYVGDGMDEIISKTGEIRHYTFNRNDQYKLKNDLVASMELMPDGDKLIGTLSGIQVIDKDGNILSDQEAIKKYPWIPSIDPSVKVILFSKNRNILWIGTELNGLYKIDLDSNKFKNFNKSNSKLDFNHILSILEDSKGNVWVGSEAIYLFNFEKETLIPYNEYGIQGNIVIKNPIYSIYEDKDKNVWLGTMRLGVLKYNPEETKILHYDTNQGESSIKSNEILSFNEDNAHQVWVGTGGAGLFRLKKDFRGFEEAPLNSKIKSLVIKCIHKDKKGIFWMGTWDAGIIKYDPVSNATEIFNPDKGNFPSRHVWNIKEDSLGNLWLATLRDGLCYFSTQNYSYKYYKNIPGDSLSLLNNDLMTLHLDKKNVLWIGSSDGLSVHYPNTEYFLNIVDRVVPNPTSGNVIFCIYEDKKGRIWAGTDGGGIFIINKNLKVEKVLKEVDGLPSNSVTAIQPDDHDYLWITTYKGMVKINSRDLSIIKAPQVNALQEREFIQNANFKSSDGRLFFGGANGFILFHPDSLKTNFHHQKIYLTSLKVFNDEIVPDKLYKGRKILSKSISETKELVLSYEDYSFTITFAPLTYNWQNSLKYLYILENLDKEWQLTNSDRRFLHYTNLAPGEYVLKIKASFDGKTWPKEATTLKIYITPPWWGTIWFKILLGLIIIFGLFMIYKLRVRFLMLQSRKLEKKVLNRTAELKKSNQEIQNLLEEVAKQSKNIELQNLQLQKINEELGNQRDNLAVKSIELENAQYNLKEINTSLEQLVNKRTEKLNDTVRELETFLYRTSHDLRGPIMSMLGLIGLGQIECKQSGADPIYFDYLLKSVLKLERTLQKLIEKHTILKLRVSDHALNKCSIIDLVQEIKKDIRFYREGELEVIIPEGFNLKTDRNLLSIILINLLENAFLFSEKAKESKVLLEFKMDGPRPVFSVTDHGVGVKPDIKEKIFGMFYRGSEISTGNGLGLYLVKSALDRIDGKIEIECGNGFTSFVVTL